MTAAALAAFAVLHPGAAAAQEGSPTISAELGGSVLGNWYTPGSTATVRIFASPGGTLLYAGSAATDEGWFEVERETHGQELVAGHQQAICWEVLARRYFDQVARNQLPRRNVLPLTVAQHPR